MPLIRYSKTKAGEQTSCGIRCHYKKQSSYILLTTLPLKYMACLIYSVLLLKMLPSTFACFLADKNHTDGKRKQCHRNNNPRHEAQPSILRVLLCVFLPRIRLG